MFRYTVQCEFTSNDPLLVERWFRWLVPGHLQDVIDAGANSAEVVKLEGQNPCFAINYTFSSEHKFLIYERDHAPRLREEGKQLFPHELGLVYQRFTGEVISSL